MLKADIEKRLAHWIAWGAAGVTLLVTDRISTDPVNVGKMVLLSVIAAGCIGICTPQLMRFIKVEKLLSISIGTFLATALISVFTSSSSWERGFYGSFGRNTGFLTYLSLTIIFLAFALVRKVPNLLFAIKALFVAGSINLIYCLFEMAGLEIFKWNNPFGKILGTFGNPDFISAFLGIYVSVLASLVASKQVSKLQRFALTATILSTLFVIKQSDALQGLIVSAFGIFLVVYFYIRSTRLNKWVSLTYIGISAVIGVVALLGTLQKGPLVSVLYKPSISYRGEYWEAGINMGKTHLLSGVGLDSYGVFYRFYRSAKAVVAPGVSVVTDASHSVPIDIFAGIGLIGLVGYLLINILVLRAAIRIFCTSKSYDPLFVSMLVAWFAYHLQSIISINQIGLAVWGWLLGGAIIAYSNIEEKNLDFQKLVPQNKNAKKTIATPLPASVALGMFIGSVIGLLIALPPFISDAKSRPAGVQRSVEYFLSVTKNWPKDNQRTNRVIVTLANGGKLAEAKDLALQSVVDFPNDYVSWFTLYQLSAEGSQERALYFKKLHELDPFNPEFAPK